MTKYYTFGGRVWYTTCTGIISAAFHSLRITFQRSWPAGGTTPLDSACGFAQGRLYGEVRWSEGTLPTDYTFTLRLCSGQAGQRVEAGLGLLDYRARFYDPVLGRFINADTLVPNPGNSQLLNRYSYAGNNPVLYNDPDGHCGPLCAIGLAAVLFFVATVPSDVRMPEPGICPNHQCRPLDRYEAAMDYMHAEMVQNAQGPIVQRIQQWHGVAEVFPIGGEKRDLAEVVWGAMVAPGMPWDHKPKLEGKLGLAQGDGDYFFPIEGDPEHEYYYDIWSNIHFGYVGAAAGFDAETLQAGAAVPGIAGANDAYDMLSIQIGIDLWNKYGLKLTPEQLHDAILAHRDEYLRIWREVYGGDKRAFRPVIDATNGR
ncbi:MAG: hypothetical protein H5T62_15925 [Anaerolineae bacterium]|nr:hypothetical protein [Anaerolineae bacterium]